MTTTLEPGLGNHSAQIVKDLLRQKARHQHNIDHINACLKMFTSWAAVNLVYGTHLCSFEHYIDAVTYAKDCNPALDADLDDEDKHERRMVAIVPWRWHHDDSLVHTWDKDSRGLYIDDLPPDSEIPRARTHG